MKKAQHGFKKHFKNLKEKMNEFKDMWVLWLSKDKSTFHNKFYCLNKLF